MEHVNSNEAFPSLAVKADHLPARTGIGDIRVTATAEHLTEPERPASCLSMAGEPFEMDMEAS